MHLISSAFFQKDTTLQRWKKPLSHLSPVLDLGLCDVLDGHLESVAVTHSCIDDAEAALAKHRADLVGLLERLSRRRHRRRRRRGRGGGGGGRRGCRGGPAGVVIVAADATGGKDDWKKKKRGCCTRPFKTFICSIYCTCTRMATNLGWFLLTFKFSIKKKRIFQVSIHLSRCVGFHHRKRGEKKPLFSSAMSISILIF